MVFVEAYIYIIYIYISTSNYVTQYVLMGAICMLLRCQEYGPHLNFGRRAAVVMYTYHQHINQALYIFIFLDQRLFHGAWKENEQKGGWNS